MNKKLYKKRRRRAQLKRPALRFSPTAWAKLLFLRDYGPTEVGGFGIAETDDPLLVTDVQLVTQACTSVSVQFDDGAVADFFDREVDHGLLPSQFARIWIHTHPGESAEPSGVDENTFARVFGASDWSIMFILAQFGETYARLQFSAGPAGELLIPVQVDYGQSFAASAEAAWEAEYQANVAALEDPWFGSEKSTATDAAWAAEREPLIGQVRELRPTADEFEPFFYEEPWYAY